MTQREVFPVRAEQAPGGTSLSLCICVLESATLTLNHTHFDPLIVVLNSPLSLERESIRASEAAQRGEDTDPQNLCDNVCMEMCMCDSR